jgi:hypothetical protein
VQRFLFALLTLVFPLAAQAQPVPPLGVDPSSMTSICAATGLCTASAPLGVGLLLIFLQNALEIIRIVFIGVCTAYFAWYGLNFIARGSDESALTEGRRAFGYAAIGMGIVGVASLLVQTFAPSFVGANIVDPTPFSEAAERIVTYIMLITGTFLIFTISFAGARLIVLQGNESEIEKQRKHFFNGLIGVVLLLLARVMVTALLPSGGPDSIVVEVAGMVKFLLEIVAALAVIALIVSGILTIVNLHKDERKQRAQRILISTVVILIIVVLSHTLIATFIP